MLKVKGLLSFLCFLTCNSLIALPSGGKVINGQAELLPSVNAFQVSAKGKTILHWDQFDIASHETVRFIQLQSGQAILNRVTSETASEILGVLKANCPIYLINPQGIFIGSGACIDTAGFLASTANLSNEAFWQGSEMLFQDFGKGCIVNLGKISATDGDVFLIARAIDNRGRIEAKNGAAIVATQEVMLHSDTKQCVFIRADQSGLEEEGIQNSGAIEALAIKLKTQSPYERAIHHTGSMQALTTLNQDGRIYLVADQGEVSVDGTLIAQSGEVRALGRKVYVENEAFIDVSGAFGGTVLVGGDTQGKNPDILNAQEIYVAKGAQIRADAVLDGDGGKVILWADQKTSVFGAVSAEGGKKSGNGGFVEISAKSNDWHYGGTVSTKAFFGKSGTLLLDPSNITISAAPSSPAFTNPYNPAVASANLYNGDLQTALSSNNVTISTSNGSGGTGNVTFSANVTWSSDQQLTVLADSNITISANISLSNTFTGSPTNDPLFNFQANLSDIQSSTIDGIDLGNNVNITSLSGDISLSGNGSVSGVGVSIIASRVTTDSGDIFITGMSGTSSANTFTRGVTLNSGSLVSSNTGNINIQGTDRTFLGGVLGHGITIINGSIIRSVVSGDINLIGINIAPATSSSQGLFVNSSGSVQSLGTGSISLMGSTAASNSAGVRINGIVSTMSGSLIIQGGYTGNSSTSNTYGVQVSRPISSTTGAIFITGNSGVGNLAGIEINNSVITTSGNIQLNGTGGQFSGSGIEILNTGASISTTDGSITLTGIAQGTGTSATGISVTSAGKVQATGSGTITLDGTASPLGTTGNSGILVSGASSTVSAASGNILMTAMGNGNSAGNTGLSVTSGGKISTTSGAITALSATGSSFGTGNCQGIVVSGLSSQITSATGTIQLTGTGGGTGTGNRGIYISSRGSITSTEAGSIALAGTGSSNGSSSNEGIFATGTSTTISNANGPIQLTGTAGGGTSNGITIDGGALVTTFTSGNITASSLNSLLINNNGSITTQGVGGPGINDIAISAQNVTIQGGAVAGMTGIVAQDGNISITCSQDLQCSAPNAGAIAAIQTFGSNMTATVGGSINLSGFTTISTPAPTGDILMIAGQNISIGTSVRIINNGTTNSSLKLVVDNDFPTAPGIGTGQFILDSGATISATGSPPVKIYTAKRSQNTINSPINGEAFVPGPFGIDTPTEQWSSYYPTDPAAPAFTIYYKESQSIAPFAPVIFNSIGANLIQLARLLPILRPALNLDRRHYHSQLCDEANGLPCDPTFSPYGSFIFEDDVYWIGAGF